MEKRNETKRLSALSCASTWSAGKELWYKLRRRQCCQKQRWKPTEAVKNPALEAAEGACRMRLAAVGGFGRAECWSCNSQVTSLQVHRESYFQDAFVKAVLRQLKSKASWQAYPEHATSRKQDWLLISISSSHAQLFIARAPGPLQTTSYYMHTSAGSNNRSFLVADRA